jgi:hypothetical protein
MLWQMALTRRAWAWWPRRQSQNRSTKTPNKRPWPVPVVGVRRKGPKNLAGVEGFEPANAGIKIRCLNQLGDTPTQDCCCCPAAFRPRASATHLSIVARKHFLEPGFYQPARGCASRLPHCLICQSPGASETVISFGNCAKTALPEPVIRPCKPCAASQFRD